MISLSGGDRHRRDNCRGQRRSLFRAALGAAYAAASRSASIPVVWTVRDCPGRCPPLSGRRMPRLDGCRTPSDNGRRHDLRNEDRPAGHLCDRIGFGAEAVHPARRAADREEDQEGRTGPADQDLTEQSVFLPQGHHVGPWRHARSATDRARRPARRPLPAGHRPRRAGVRGVHAADAPAHLAAGCPVDRPDRTAGLVGPAASGARDRCLRADRHRRGRQDRAGRALGASGA